jgi:hypothetical protein
MIAVSRFNDDNKTREFHKHQIIARSFVKVADKISGNRHFLKVGGTSPR